MSEATVQGAPTPPTAMKMRYEALTARITRIKPALAIPIVAFLIGATVMLMYSPLRQMEGGDSAVYDYMAQSIVRGQIPYRDFQTPRGLQALA